MTARDVQKILGARVLTGEEFLDREITKCLRIRHDERCAGLFQGSFGSDHRTLQSAGDPHGGDVRHCLCDLCTEKTSG